MVLFLSTYATNCKLAVAILGNSGELKEINSYDKSIMEKVALLEALNENEKQTIYTMLDAFIGKKKLKDALSGVLKDVE